MKRNAILCGISALACALIYGFFALPAQTTPLGALLGNPSGYDFVDAVLKNFKLYAMMDKAAAIAGLVLLILAGVTLVISILLLLCEVKVIKNDTVRAFLIWAFRYVTSFLILAAVVQLMTNAMAGYGVGDYSTDSNLIKTKPGWAMIIISFVLAIVPCGISAYIQYKAKKETAATATPAPAAKPAEEEKPAKKENPNKEEK